MKRILFGLAIILASLKLSAQATSEVFYFNQLTSKLDESGVNMSYVGDHFLGEQIAIKLQILKDSYTWTEPESATVPSPRLVIEKPEIYNNVKKVERYYKKALKTGSMTQAQATEEFGNILNIAIYIRNQQTTTFEETLKSLKDDESIVSLFTKNVMLKAY